MNTRLGAAVFAVLALGALAGCGLGSDTGSSGDASSTASDASSVTTSGDGEEASSVTPDEDESAAEIESSASDGAPSIEWSGPAFVDAAEARIAELEASFGQPYSADAVASIFEMPADFPVVPGTITGIFSLAEVDIRDGEMTQDRIVGTDAVLTKEDLEAHAELVRSDSSVEWKAASISDGGSNFISLFTSETDPDPARRLLMQSFVDPKEGSAPLNWELDLVVSELATPSWAASLPIPEGGTLGGYREGVGVVEDFGWVAEDGFLEITMTYPADALSELEAFFSTDVLKQAGFTYEDTPFNNQSVRIDLSIEDWAGRVSVWEGSYGDTTYYGVTWTLVRPIS